MRPSRMLLVVGFLSACGSDTGTNNPPPPPPPPPPPVASVQVIGYSRVKVGDGYQLSVEARTGDGSIVQRAVSWSVLEPGKGTVSASGLFTPQQTGQITVRATVEGVTAEGTATSYDWVPVNGSGIIGLGLDADVLVTNKFGQSEYPGLVVGCSNGLFVLGVGLDRFVTASGAVAYAFDNAAPVTETWLEGDDFDLLGYPGVTNLSRKNFANQMAASSRFHFTFTEFQSTAKTTTFRLTGLAQRLGPVLAACPSNALRAASLAGNLDLSVLARVYEAARSES